MATYRLWAATGGPATAVNYSGSYVGGITWQANRAGLWYYGHQIWCCNAGQPTTPVKGALWNCKSSSAGTLVPGTVATSAPLVPGTWNYFPIATPVPVAIGTAYVTEVALNGPFPDTTGQFGAGEPFAGGLTVGPITAYADSTRGGGPPVGYGLPQGPFTTTGSDPSVSFVNEGDESDNLWVDLLLSDVPPAGYNGPYRLWPNKIDASPATGLDNAAPFILANEYHLSEPCLSSRIKFWSNPGAASLPTWAGIYPASGVPGITQPIAGISAPAWVNSAGGPIAAGGGWCYCPLVKALPAGQYKIGAYNSAGGAGAWSSREYGYYLTGNGASGISWGPVSSPASGAGASAYVYTSNAGSSPPYTNGDIEPANGSFALDNSLVTGMPQFPYLCADYTKDVSTPPGAIAENFWIDLEVTPMAAGYPTWNHPWYGMGGR